MAWGRPASCSCGTCHKCERAAYMREWYGRRSAAERKRLRQGRNLELARQRDRKRHERMSGQLEYELRRQAVSALNNAVKRGDVEREPCERCASTTRANGHHDDYHKPLEVRWLCPQCHADEHRKAA